MTYGVLRGKLYNYMDTTEGLTMCYNKISKVDDYIKIIDSLENKGFIAFRGQCCSTWSLEPGIIRRVKNTYKGIGQSGLLFRLSVDHTIELLDNAKVSDHLHNNDCDLNTLAILQHYGAATPLLDFSYDSLVALYFACQPFEQNHIASDGKVFCLNYPNQVRSASTPMRQVTNPSTIKIEDVLGADHPGIWYWKPPDDLPCKRSEKQQSVFIFGWGLYWEYNTDRLIDELTTIPVSANNKQNILEELDKHYGISEQNLFPDLSGFAKSYSHDKLIKYFSTEDFYRMGEEQYRDGSFEWAAEYYRMAFTKRPDWIDARCKCALSLAYLGEQSDAITVLDESIETLGKKWQFFACKAKCNNTSGISFEADLKRANDLAAGISENNECVSYIQTLGIISNL